MGWRGLDDLLAVSPSPSGRGVLRGSCVAVLDVVPEIDEIPPPVEEGDVGDVGL